MFGAGDGPFHAFDAWGQNKFGAQHGEQSAPFQRHRVGHGEDDPVTLGGGHESQGDAGVAAGRFDDHRVALEETALLRVFDHGHTDAVLDAAEGIEEFALEQDGGLQLGCDFIEADQRSVTDGFDDVVKYASHNN